MLLYTVVLVVGGSCELLHGGLSQSHHQHHGDQGSSAPNAFCAWICQATADAMVAIGPPMATADLILGVSEFITTEFVLSTPSSERHLRAPPLSFRLG